MTSFQMMMTSDDALASRVAGYLASLRSLGVEDYLALQLTLAFQSVLCAEGATKIQPPHNPSKGQEKDAIDTSSSK